MSAGCVDANDEPDTTADSTAEATQDLIGPHIGPEEVLNFAGVARAYSPLGSLAYLKANNAFFKNLGTSGRTCASCHGIEGGWTASASLGLWFASNGTDPLFMHTHDNGLCPSSDISTKSRRAHAMELTLERGSTRGATVIKPTWEFEVTMVEDPYNCPETSLTNVFGYRKPNPLTGVSKKTSVTWAPAEQPDMRAAVKAVFVGGTQLHGITTYVPTDEEQNQAADFMLFNYFAQSYDFLAGPLDADGARGGPVNLANQPWFVGINHASTGPTTKKVFDIYDAWIDADQHSHGILNRIRDQRRALIAEGQEIFNFRQNANGGTCSGCHNSPNVGTRSVYQLFDIGIVDVDDPGLPRIHIRNKSTGQERVVNNLGRGGSTGLWADVGKMSVPILRGLAQRAPYFDSGQARTLWDVVDHYDHHFNFGFTSHEKEALVAFLSAL